MAVIECKEDHVGRGGTNAGFDNDQETRSWYIKTDDRQDSKPEIEAALLGSTLPRPFVDRYPGKPHCLCKALDIKQQDDKGGMVWRATAHYDSKPMTDEEREQKSGEQPDPLLRAAIYSVGFERDQKPVRYDQDQKIIVNSAGDVFLDPVSRPRTRMRIKGRKNVPVNAIPNWFFDLQDCINDDEYEIVGRQFEKHTLLFIPGDISEPMEQNEVPYQVIHWELEYKPDGWQEKRIDNGYNQLAYNPETGANDLKVPIEIDGARPAEPQLLRNGVMIPREEVADGAYEELEFDTIPEGDFDDIGT